MEKNYINGIESHVFGTMRNLEKVVSKSFTADNDCLQDSILNFLETRESGKYYSESDISKIVFKDYKRIQQKNRRAEEKEKKSRSDFDLGKVEVTENRNLFSDDFLDLAEEILTGKQYIDFLQWLDSGLPDYKSYRKEHNRLKKSIGRILKTLAGSKSISDLLEGLGLDSFTDSLKGIAIYKAGKKEYQKYDQKPTDAVVYFEDYNKMHEKIKKKKGVELCPVKYWEIESLVPVKQEKDRGESEYLEQFNADEINFCPNKSIPDIDHIGDRNIEKNIVKIEKCYGGKKIVNMPENNLRAKLLSVKSGMFYTWIRSLCDISQDKRTLSALTVKVINTDNNSMYYRFIRTLASDSRQSVITVNCYTLSVIKQG